MVKQKIWLWAVIAVLLSSFCVSFNGRVFATEEENSGASATSISVSPVSKILQIEASSVYEDSFRVTNSGSGDMPFEVYASPYSYVPAEDGKYKLGFSTENSYTQITRWITFKDTAGNYVKNPRFVAKPGESVVVEYKITTPASLPSGGQYAVLFAHTLSSTTGAGGIKTEASPGLIVYGRASGETVNSSEISDLTIGQTVEKKDGNKVTTEKFINGSAKVKNTGNVDFMGVGKLNVTGIFGNTLYETPETDARVSIIPEAELYVTDVWEETPSFGLFHVTWTVTAANGDSEMIERTIFMLSPFVIVFIFLVLTAMSIFIIIVCRKRKMRRSRLAV